MAFPSRVLGAGTSGGTTTAICGDVANTLTAAGSNQATALAISAAYNRVSTTAASTGVILPPSETGAMMVVANDGASSLQVYCQTGSTIDGVAAGTGVAIATTKRRVFVGISPTVWVSILGA
jgi:hypothetical protein